MRDDKQGGALRNTLYKRKTRSGRRLGAGRKLLFALLVPVAEALIRLWWSSCRIRTVVGAQHLDAVLAQNASFLPAYWHQHHLFCARYLLGRQRDSALRVGFLISPSLDGEIGAQLMKRLGGVVIRGSSSNTGALALKDYYQALTKEGISPVINPDGPRGPRFKCKPGVVLLAQMSNRPILPLAYAARRAWLIHWDKFVLPWPFTRIAVAVGEPLRVPRTLDAAGVAALQTALEHSLYDAYRAARAALETR